MVKRIGAVVLYVTLILAGAFIFPRLSTSNPKVDSTGCLDCHEVGQFGAQDGSLHGSHSSCAICHDGGAGQAGNVSAGSCLTCHPAAGSDLCDLVNFHEDSMAYDPSGASCLTCHAAACDGGNGSTTTTSSPPQSTIRDSRYEIFLVGTSEVGCSSSTLTFRSDNVLILDCIEGFGTYLSIANVFTAFYWSNNFYQGSGMVLFFSGIAIDPYITGGGIAFFNNRVQPVIITGYRLDIS